jgi:hypothetical protein
MALAVNILGGTNDAGFFAGIIATLTAAGYTMSSTATTFSAKQTDGEPLLVTIENIAANVLRVSGGPIRFVRPGWRITQGAQNQLVVDVNPVAGTVTVHDATALAVGGADAKPGWETRLDGFLDSANHRIHFLGFRTQTGIGQIGNLIRDSGIEFPAVAFDVWIVADLNGMAVVAKFGAGQYAVCHAGNYLPLRPFQTSGRAKLSIAALAGAFTVTLRPSDADQTGWTVGQIVYLTDPATGLTEKHTIAAIAPGPETFTFNEALVNNLAIGTWVSRDPHPLLMQGSIYGAAGGGFLFQTPDSVALNPNVTLFARAKSMTPLESARLGGDADGATIIQPFRYERFGANADEVIGVNLRLYDMAGSAVADETMVTDREFFTVFTDRATGRKFGLRTSAWGFFQVGA